MRDDGTLDDQCGLGGSADRSDDSSSTVRSTSPCEPSTSRLPGLGFLRTRLRGFANPLAPRPGRTRLAVATGAVCCLGLVGVTQVGAGAVGGTKAPAQPAEVAERATPDAASRGSDRQTPAPVAQTADPDVSPSATKKPVAKPKPKPKPKRIAPVAGLDEDQMDNAKAIVRAGRDMGVPRRGLVIAVATAMQESNLYNYASAVLPESQNYPHQAIGWDHDSVGLFQQRPSSGWGAVEDLMQPEYATKQFLAALEQIPGWQDMALTDAAQAVQVSAFPWAYAQHEWRAERVVDAILG
ncbi:MULTISPECIES: peptidase M23 [Micromonospora]|uniref:Peptidase M23 n=1 Tax=Micromonospora sicca TaxID=2202420 RepID=A0A317D0V9_9ACTN|nr:MULTISPECIES: peptidase M23 [unclassified Micromonospora]MBM0225134.1 peptidase M23 [Micromonospora sp. ATA51]PWR06213.1 peptidase M23 [Micromonospora sp. 4G51]